MRLILVTGKGGVGKTTVAAATAVRLAEEGHRVLAVSADPAHSLADALDVPLDAAPREVAEGLRAAQLDPRGAADGLWPTLQRHLSTVLAGAGVSELSAEELVMVPALDELLTLLEVRRYAHELDDQTGQRPELVVVDCGPTADALRAMAAPEALRGLLERLFPTHRRVVRGLLAGMVGAADAASWDALAEAVGRAVTEVEQLRDLLRDPARCTVRLVTTPERVVAAETRRLVNALALHELHTDAVVVNRLVPKPGSGGTSIATRWLRQRRVEQERVLAELAQLGPVTAQLGYLAAEPVGRPALAELATELYGQLDVLPEVTGSDLMAVRPSGPVPAEAGDTERGYQLLLRMPLPQDAAESLELARVGDELSLTVSGRRRLVALPPVLTRCEVVDAELGEEGIVVHFAPDPAVWMR